MAKPDSFGQITRSQSLQTGPYEDRICSTLRYVLTTAAQWEAFIATHINSAEIFS